MKFLSHIVNTLDSFLSPELRKMDMRDLARLRFLVFAILFIIPCGFLSSLLLKTQSPDHHFLIYQGYANLLVALVLLVALRNSRTYHRVATFTVLWMHALFIFHMLALPSVFSLVYLWSSSLIVFSSLIFGMRGAIFSSFGLTTLSVLNILYQYEQNSPWLSLDFDIYMDQILLFLAGSTLLTAAVAGVYEYMRDFSDRHQARQRLIAARHAHTGAVGELVGHVAHEVNNPLAILQGSAARLRRQLERDDWNHDARKLLANMLRSHERIIRVQQSLAVFASGNQHEPFVSYDIRAILKDVQLAMKPQAQAQEVKLDFQITSAKQSLRCQPHQLIYVLCSLIQNALDACREHVNPKIAVKVEDNESMLRISVVDNGVGIDASNKDRIFEPFFTTKANGSAQGLSLSVCRGILARHGGSIHFKSMTGATTFTCEIPHELMSEIRLSKGA